MGSKEGKLESVRAPLPESVLLANLGMVHQMAWRMAQGFSLQSHFEDMVQEGVMGLMRAWSVYTPDRGAKFVTYAYGWVRGYITNYVESNVSVVNRRKAQEERSKVWHGMPGDLELDRPKSANPGASCGVDLLIDEGEGPEEMVGREELVKRVRWLVGKAAHREAHWVIMEGRWLTDPPRPRVEIGRELGVTGSCVEQVEKRLMGRVASRLREEFRGMT